MFLANKLMPRQTGASGDPYFNSVSLLLHMDGTNGGTTFIDNSSNNHTITPSNVTTNTTVKKFGSASGYFGIGGGATPSTNSWLNLPTSSTVTLGTGDFTLETWVYRTANPAVSILFSTCSNDTSAGGFAIYTTGAGVLNLFNFVTNTTTISGSTAIPLNEWVHVAITRSSNSVRFFINGTNDIAPTTDTTNYTSSAGASVGGYGSGVLTGYSWPGYIDEVRWTKGVARYSANFSVPTEAFPNSL